VPPVPTECSQIGGLHSVLCRAMWHRSRRLLQGADGAGGRAKPKRRITPLAERTVRAARNGDSPRIPGNSTNFWTTMIYYAFEILIGSVLLLIAFFVYRLLINSSRFTRFIERTMGTRETEIGDIDVRLAEGKRTARQIADEARDRIRREAAAADRLDKQL